MNINDICQTNVTTINKTASIRKAAEMMQNACVGSLVVTEENKPIGMITDRDIVVKLIAKGHDYINARVADCMSDSLCVLSKDAEIDEIMSTMQEKSVRRVPLIDDQGQLAGIVSLDDLCLLVEKEQDSIADIIRTQTPKKTKAQAAELEAEELL